MLDEVIVIKTIIVGLVVLVDADYDVLDEGYVEDAAGV